MRDAMKAMCCLLCTRNLAQACPRVSAETPHPASPIFTNRRNECAVLSIRRSVLQEWRLSLVMLGGSQSLENRPKFVYRMFLVFCSDVL